MKQKWEKTELRVLVSISGMTNGCTPGQISFRRQCCRSCLILCDTKDYTVPGILQAKILEWVAFPLSKGSSQPRDPTQISGIAGRFFTSWVTREAPCPKTVLKRSSKLSSLPNTAVFFFVLFVFHFLAVLNTPFLLKAHLFKASVIHIF